MAALLTLPLLTTGALAEGNKAIDRFVLAQGVKLTQEMDTLAESELFLKAMGVTYQDMTVLTAEIGKGDYATPSGAVILTIKEEAWPAGIAGIADALGDAPDIVRRKMMESLIHLPLGYYNGMQGVNVVSACSMLGISTCYAAPEGWDGHKIAVLDYPGGYASVIVFMKNENGLLEVRSGFVKAEDPEAELFAPAGSPLNMLSVDQDKKTFTAAETAALLK